MKKDKKDKFDHSGHQHGHQDMQPDPLKTENHEEHVAFLKDRYGFNIHGSNEAEKQYEAGDGPRIPPVDALFKSGKDEKRIEESLDRSYELTKEAMGKNPEGMTRRNFLKAASMASAAAGVAMAGKGLVPAGDAEALSLGPIYLDPFIGWTPLKKQQNYSKPDLATWEPKVAVVKKNTSDTIEETVYKAIEEAGKLDEIQEGDWVLIKVNASVPITRNIIPDSDGDIDAPATTNPEVLRAVIRAVKERTAAKNIWVGDQAMIGMDTVFVMQMVGQYNVAISEGVNCCSMSDWSPVAYKSDKFEWIKSPFNLPGRILEFDHMINLPVIKNHEMLLPPIRDSAQYTCCHKAFIGVLSPNNRFVFIGLSASSLTNTFHLWNLPEQCVELNLSRPWRMGTTHSGKYGNPGITMNIVDAIDVITEGGPTPLLSGWIVNQVAHPKMIIASKDRVACDSVALAVLKKYALAQGSTKDYTKIPVWGQRQIRHGAKKGLGTNKMPKINVKYTGLDPLEENAIKTIWEQGYSPNDSDYNIYGKPTTLLGF